MREAQSHTFAPALTYRSRETLCVIKITDQFVFIYDCILVVALVSWVDGSEIGGVIYLYGSLGWFRSKRRRSDVQMKFFPLWQDVQAENGAHFWRTLGHPTCSWRFFMRISSFLIPSTSCSRSVVTMVKLSKVFRRPSTSISKSFLKECSFSYLLLEGRQERARLGCCGAVG